MTIFNRLLEISNEMDRINKKLTGGKEKMDPFEIQNYCHYTMVCEKGVGNLPSICDDFKFKTIYLTYCMDLTFKSIFRKPNFNLNFEDNFRGYADANNFNIKNKNNDKFDEINYKSIIENSKNLFRNVEIEEVQNDIEYLNKVAREWETVINNLRHTDQKLKQSSEETRKNIKKLKKNSQKSNTPEYVIDNDIKFELWKSKYIHYQAVLISSQIELKNSFPYELKLNGVTIYFTFRSLFHILYFHFAQLVSSSSNQEIKSYHSPIFQPNEIHLVLESIFQRLSKSEHFNNLEIKHNTSYNFQYKEVDYQLYLKEFKFKNSDKLMVSSIYPIENIIEIKKLNLKELKPVDNELKVYK